MEGVVKTALVLLSILTGLLFTASLCYSLVIGYSVQPATDQPVTLNTPTVDTNEETLAEIIDETVTHPTATEPADQIAPNAPSVNVAPGGLTWNGLKIEVTAANYDAWPLIEAQNHNNSPPLAGLAMLLMTVRITNLEGTIGEPVRLTSSDFQLIGNDNTVYKTFQMSCGVVPDGLDGVVDLGGSFDGNICFQVPAEEKDFKLIYEPTGSPAVYFDLPNGEDNKTILPALVEADGLTWNGLKIDIADINYDAWLLIKAQNQFNQPPLEGMTMLLVTIRATNLEGPTDGFIKLIDSNFQLIGSRGVVYKTFQISCGVVPDRLSSVVAFGASTEANVCFQVPVDERDFQLIYEPSGSPATYFDLPKPGPEK